MSEKKELKVVETTYLSEEDEKVRWKDLDYLLYRTSPFALNEGEKKFDEVVGDQVKEVLHQYIKVLIIGAGGLGCDLLKNLALSGFKDIHIIDMDEIDLSNLNRQFLFRQKDVGQSKAIVAANFVMERVPGCKVTPYYGKIQDKTTEYYEQFSIIVCGLDSIPARQWINKKLCDMVKFEDEEQTKIDMSTVKVMIDGGTEGFKGQARIILPRITSCFECTMDLFPTEENFPECTIASKPRLPEHCIAYIVEKVWKETKGKPDIKDDIPISGDNVHHIQWIYERAKERADKFGIKGVSLQLTKGVVKRIIPAIASTNAVIASACTNECLKYATWIADNMHDYMMYNGNEGIFTYTYQNERKSNCKVCQSILPSTIKCTRNDTLSDILNKKMPENKSFKKRINKEVQDPFVIGTECYYNVKLLNMYQANLNKTLDDLAWEQNEVITVTCPNWEVDGEEVSFRFYADFGEEIVVDDE